MSSCIIDDRAFFEACSEIDFCFFAIKELCLNAPSPLTKEHVKSTIALMECIIKNKKKIGADYSNTEQAIKDLKSLRVYKSINK